MADVFISYSSKNSIEAMALCNSLEEQGLPVWIAPRDIPAGSEYGEEIIKGIEGSKVLLLCLSKESVQSQHVLREVERAVNRNMTIIVYQMEEVILTKSLEYFLASTQWFIPEVNGGVEELGRIIYKYTEDAQPTQHVSRQAEAADGEVTHEVAVKSKMVQKTNRSSGKVFGAIGTLAVLFAVVVGFFWWQSTNKTPVEVGTTFAFGALRLQGVDLQPIEWMVLSVDEEANTALCITEKIVAFGPFDGAESGVRGQCGEIYYQEGNLSQYTEEQLKQFWGSSDWETSSVRTWLNSDDVDVEYIGQPPTEDTTSLYENDYVHRAGFLEGFTEEEKDAIVPMKIESIGMNGEPVTTADNVYLLSKEEVERYFTSQNRKVVALPTEQAENADGTGIYTEYKEQGVVTASWGLREAGDIPACTILCAGEGMRYEEKYHSEYACSSLIGIRPAIVLPISEVENRVAENMENNE